jgi:hypothetical protein
MLNRAPLLPRVTALAAALALAACGGGEDNSLNVAGNDADPALTSALEDQILVDPTLAQQSNKNAVRPPETPTQAQYPAGVATGGGTPAATPAAGQAPRPAQGGGTANCTGNVEFAYGNDWANRLPAAFGVIPNARITEAAGAANGCRVVTFTTSENWQKVLDWYHTRAVRAGYSSEQQVRDGDRLLAGANESDGSAFFLIVTPKQQGAEVALITNNGR